MITFYEWLKNFKDNFNNVEEIKVQRIHGYADCPIGYEDLPIVLPKKDVIRLRKMYEYVIQNTDVTDTMFYEMLEDKHLKDYKSLSHEYLPADGGIASDLREDGWFRVAQYITYQRNQNAKFEKAIKTHLPGEHSTHKHTSNKQLHSSFSPKLREYKARNQSQLEDDFGRKL